VRKNKGFTLVEIIISIAILTIISSFFLVLMANHYSIFNKTKAITEDVFLTQREIEEEIDLVKQEIQDINNGETPSNPRTVNKQSIFDSDLGGIEVSYYEVEKSLNSKIYFTLVSTIKPEPLEKIKLDSIDSKLKHNDNDVEYGYTTSDFSIIGEFNNLELYKYDHLLNQVEWYVSNEKFNMPMPKSESLDMFDPDSYYFPVFPRDYKLIDNETIDKFGLSTNIIFDKLTEFGGRNIVFTVTPAARSGKLGEQMVSDPIFVSGLPITEGLIMHFDASYIDVTILNEVQVINNDWNVWTWFDISSIIGNTSLNDFAQKLPAISEKPKVKRTEVGVGFIGQYVSFNENQELVITQNTSGYLTVLSIVKNRSLSEEAEYFKHGNIVLKLGPNDEENIGNWRVEWDVISTQNNTFEIGGKNVDIAEMLIFEGLLDDNKIDDIETYIENKYIDVIIIDE